MAPRKFRIIAIRLLGAVEQPANNNVLAKIVVASIELANKVIIFIEFPFR